MGGVPSQKEDMFEWVIEVRSCGAVAVPVVVVEVVGAFLVGFVG